MTPNRTPQHLIELIQELRKLPKETEWVEFKVNDESPEHIGEYLSALANSAALAGKELGYLVWGIEDATHRIVGTKFSPRHAKVGNEELENWLLHMVTPRVQFRFFEFACDEKHLVVLEVGRATRQPVQFRKQEFIRVGSYMKKLTDLPEKERALWRVFEHTPFERLAAADEMRTDEVLSLLDYPAYFEMLQRPLPETREVILEALAADDMIVPTDRGHWKVTNLGAILFARKLADFRQLKRKAVRVVFYEGTTRVTTIREHEAIKGYANGFVDLITFITSSLPSNEVMGKALRKTVPMYPTLAVRELVANAIIHQDFPIAGCGPMIEVFADRMEVTNPGIPLVKTDRFLDSPPRSRNEALASFMRRIGVCEERGSGIDKVVFQTEVFQLPAPTFEVIEEQTRATLFSHRPLSRMDKSDRIWACYLHACLRYVNRDFMTNSSLRERFGIIAQNSATASRLIKEAIAAELIRAYDVGSGRKYMKYIPWWAL